MTQSLPSVPNLEQLKKQAKDLLKDHKSQSESCCAILKHLTKFAGNSNQQIFSAVVSLQEMQHALAKNYGFDSWQSLRVTVLSTDSSTDQVSKPMRHDIRINLLPDANERWPNQEMRPLLVLDISSSGVRLLELSKAGVSYRVERYGFESLPVNAVVEKNVSDVKAVGQAIRRVVQNAKSITTDVAIAVAGSAAITKTIEMPVNMSEDDRRNTIAAESSKYLPIPLDKLVFDFEVQRISPRDNELVEVLLAACLREIVDRRIEAVALGGLQVRVVDLEVHCVTRAYRLIAKQLDRESDEVVAIVDFGASMLTMSVLTGAGAPYTRVELFGGYQLTKEIRNRYDLTLEQAESAKMLGSLPADYQGDVLHPFREAAAERIESMLTSFYADSRFDAVDRIVLSGGSASLDGLAPVISLKLGTPTTIANPFADMKLSPNINASALRNDAPALMLACGLAMRSFEKL